MKIAAYRYQLQGERWRGQCQLINALNPPLFFMDGEPVTEVFAWHPERLTFLGYY